MNETRRIKMIPPILTMYERETLRRAFYHGYRYISRDSDRELILTKTLPTLRFGHWDSEDGKYARILDFTSDYDFIRYEDRMFWRISDLLNLRGVGDDDE